MFMLQNQPDLYFHLNLFVKLVSLRFRNCTLMLTFQTTSICVVTSMIAFPYLHKLVLAP